MPKTRARSKKQRAAAPAAAERAQRVPIWDVKTKKKHAGKSAPLLRDTARYLEQHPDREVYCGQDMSLDRDRDCVRQYVAVWDKQRKKAFMMKREGIVGTLEQHAKYEIYHEQDWMDENCIVVEKSEDSEGDGGEGGGWNACQCAEEVIVIDSETESSELSSEHVDSVSNVAEPPNAASVAQDVISSGSDAHEPEPASPLPAKEVEDIESVTYVPSLGNDGTAAGVPDRSYEGRFTPMEGMEKEHPDDLKGEENASGQEVALPSANVILREVFGDSDDD